MWVLGLFFGLLGSIGVNTGNNLQSLGLHKLHEREKRECAPGEHLPNSASVIWVVGTSLFVAASLMNFAAFAFAPASLLASLEATQFATNIIFSKFVLKQDVASRMYIGTVTVIVSTICVVWSFVLSPVPEIDASISLISDNFMRLPYILFILSMVGLAFILYPFTEKLRAYNTNPKNKPSWRQQGEPVCYALFSAIFGTQAVVFAKGLAIFAQRPWKKNRQKNTFVTPPPPPPPN